MHQPPPARLAVAGLIEGFYGRPWSWDERVEVMRFCAERGMSHYVYAPKDDPKHRHDWRAPYDGAELDGFRRLVGEGGLEVGFAVSPGLSMDYGDGGDRTALLAKLEQAVDVGITLVCLALDDIPLRPGLGDEHAGITAWLHDRLGERARLLLVPTEYIGTASSPYLDALSAAVPPDVPIAWTGASVVNDAVTAAEATARANALGGRPPLLWDNYPVNDGLMGDRLYMGPLWGRDPGLLAACSGYLANPMVQPRCSKLPLASVAAWLRGEDPVDAWAREAGEARVFAEACDGSVPRALVAALSEEGDGPGWPGPATRLARWLEEAAHCDAPGLEDEARPWLDQTRAEAGVALLGLRLYQATRPVVTIDADGHGRAAAVDPDRIVALAFRLAAAWREVRRGPASVMGARWSFRPALDHRPGGGWRLRRDALEEDHSAVDRLARLALAAASEATGGPLWVGADGDAVTLGDDGSFQVAPGAVVLARSGSAVTRASVPARPPVEDGRLRR